MTCHQPLRPSHILTRRLHFTRIVLEPYSDMFSARLVGDSMCYKNTFGLRRSGDQRVRILSSVRDNQTELIYSYLACDRFVRSVFVPENIVTQMGHSLCAIK